MSIEISIICSPENVVITKSQYQFPDEGGTLGRAGTNFWVLEDPNKYMSSVHAQVSCEVGQYYLTDLSTNGTFVNGAAEPVGHGNQVQLIDGDQFAISDYMFVVKISAQNSATDSFLGAVNDDPFSDFGGASFSDNNNSLDDFAAPAAASDPFAFGVNQFAVTGSPSSEALIDPLAILDNGAASSMAGSATSSLLDDLDSVISQPQTDSQASVNHHANQPVVTDSIDWPSAKPESAVIPDDWDDDFLSDSHSATPTQADPFASYQAPTAQSPVAQPSSAQPLNQAAQSNHQSAAFTQDIGNSDPFASHSGAGTAFIPELDDDELFAGIETPTAQPDPFATAPSSATADPFAIAPSAAQADPFATSPVQAEPLAAETAPADPFSSALSPAQPEAFLTDASAVSDPFATSPSAAQPQAFTEAPQPVTQENADTASALDLVMTSETATAAAVASVATQTVAQTTSAANIQSNSQQSVNSSQSQLEALQAENTQLRQQIVLLQEQLANKPASAPVSANAAEAMHYVIETMGLAKWNIEANKVADINRMVGTLTRETMKGLMQVLKFRKKIKEEFRINVTTIQSVENNPLKFSANIDDAMENMFIKENNAYKPPIDAVKEGFESIAEHQVAVIAGMQAAFRGMIQRFDPQQLENRFEKYNNASFISLGQKGKRWNDYKAYHKEISENLDDSFQHLFGYDFVQAYEEQMQQLITARASENTTTSQS